MRSIELNKLETESTKSLLKEYSIPAIIGTLVIALYNIIDSIYIGHGLGDHAIGGLGIVLPIMTLMAAIGALVGTGAAGRISIFLGMGDQDSAEYILGNALSLIILLTGLFILFLYAYIDPVLQAIGATNETYPFAYEFLLFYLPCSLFLNISYTLCSVMRASGYPQKAMYTMLLGIVVNILLAPVFIFVLKWGMKGAAIASSIAAFISLIPVILHFLDKKNTLQFQRGRISLNLKTTWEILSIGLSPFIIQMAASLVVFFINAQLRIYGGSVAIEAYTIANRLTLVIILILVGLTQGMQPIVGYNYGAKKIDRVKSTVNHAIKAGVCIGLFGLIIGFFFADIVIKPFNPSLELASQSALALKIITLLLPLSGIQMVISVFFQSINMPLTSTALSLTRQFLFLIPALFILPRFFALDGIWISIPVADFLSTVLAIGLYIWKIRKLSPI